MGAGSIMLALLHRGSVGALVLELPGFSANDSCSCMQVLVSEDLTSCAEARGCLISYLLSFGSRCDRECSARVVFSSRRCCSVSSLRISLSFLLPLFPPSSLYERRFLFID